MRADRFLTLDGKEAVVVGPDNKLPILDASNLTNIEKSLVGKIIEILKDMPSAPFNEDDIGRYILYAGDAGQYEKNAIYQVVYSSGVYSFEKISASSDIVGLPPVTAADNAKTLVVVNGVWEKSAAPISATTANVRAALGINAQTGSPLKILNQKGSFIDLPDDEDTVYTAGIGIEIDNNVVGLSLSSSTAGQVLKRTFNGVAWGDVESGDVLPEVTSSDNNKVLTVVNGTWAKADLPDFDNLPSVTVADNSKVLTVVSGVWSKAAAPVSATTANVKTALGIDGEHGSDSKVLNERGAFVDMGGASTPVKTQILACPHFDSSVHLTIRVSELDDFSEFIVLVDTINEIGLDKVRAFNGSVFTSITKKGFSPIFGGSAIKIDMTGYNNVNILYKWSSSDGDSDWYATFFPSSCEAFAPHN